MSTEKAGGPKPLHTPLLLAASVHSPKANVKCAFKHKCKGALITKRDTGVQFLAVKAGQPEQLVHLGCIKCGRLILLRHLNNLSRFQGWIVDALNKASHIEYAKTQQLKNWENNRKFVKVSERDESE